MLFCFGRFFAYMLFMSVFFAGSSFNAVANVIGEKHGQEYNTLPIDEVVSIINEHYIKDISLQHLVDGALFGMLRSVDDYSDYLSPEHYREFKAATDGRLFGIGIEIARRDGLFIIASVIPNSPAAKAGLESGDIILSVDNLETQTMTTVKLITCIRGEDGFVKIKVGRSVAGGSDKVLNFNIKRAKLSIKPLDVSIVDSNFLKISIYAFSRDSYSNLFSELKRIKRRKEVFKTLKGVVIDLRGNLGGLLEQTVDISGLFLKKKRIVTVKTKSQKSIADFIANDEDDILDGLPIAVLVDNNTASAAEILAAALQENNRAVVVGSKTYGKGVVQDVFELFSVPDAAIKLTFAMYYTPLNRTIDGVGVSPDLDLARIKNEQQYVNVKDIGMKASINVLSNKKQYESLITSANHSYSTTDMSLMNNDASVFTFETASLSNKLRNSAAVLNVYGQNLDFDKIKKLVSYSVVDEPVFFKRLC